MYDNVMIKSVIYTVIQISFAVVGVLVFGLATIINIFKQDHVRNNFVILIYSLSRDNTTATRVYDTFLGILVGETGKNNSSIKTIVYSCLSSNNMSRCTHTFTCKQNYCHDKVEPFLLQLLYL